MTIYEYLREATWKMLQETGSGGFCEVTLTDEVYDKLVLELGSKVHYTPSNNTCDGTGSDSLQLFLVDRYCTVLRESRYVHYGRTLREAS